MRQKTSEEHVRQDYYKAAGKDVWYGGQLLAFIMGEEKGIGHTISATICHPRLTLDRLMVRGTPIMWKLRSECVQDVDFRGELSRNHVSDTTSINIDTGDKRHAMTALNQH